MLPSLPVLALLTPKDSSVLPKKLPADRLRLLSTPVAALATSRAQWKPPWLTMLPFLAPTDSSALSISKELQYDRLDPGLLSTPKPAVATSVAQSFDYHDDPQG